MKPVEINEDDEIEGLVGARLPKVASGLISAKCQLVLLFSFASFFFLLVGFLVGRDTAQGGDYRTPNRPPGMVTGGGETTKSPSSEGGKEELSAEFKATLKRFASARDMAEKTLQKLVDYYGDYVDKVLLGNTAFGFGFTGPDRQPTNPESFKRNVDIIARALVHGETLKLGFIGSSVMCGHDNCYYDSFPAQLEREIQSIFTTAGSKLDIRNACQGGGCGDSFENQIFCFRHMVGDDIDFLFYEWTYFEGEEAYVYHDLIARWAALLPKIPATIIFNCDRNAWTRTQVMNNFAKFGANALNLEAGLRAGAYKGKEWGIVGDGLHTTTRYGENESEERKKSLGVVFRNWHPGPLGLQYISDLTSYLFLRALIEAMNEIEKDILTAKERWPKFPRSLGPLPEPSFSKKDHPILYSLTDLEEAPGCYDFQQKTFGHSILSIADKSDDELNPYKNVIKKVGSSEEAWSLWDAGPNWSLVPQKERSMGDICLPPDHCAYITPPVSGHAPIVFRLPKMTVGLIVVCGGNGEAGAKQMIDGALAAEFDGKQLDSSKFLVFPIKKCICLQQAFTGPVEDKHGHLYLSIVSNKHFEISQVITA